MKLIKFYADWCGPCKTLAPTIDKIVQNNLTIQYESVNVDENSEKAKEYNIKGIPAVVIISDDGTVKDTIFGAQPEEIYLQTLKS